MEQNFQPPADGGGAGSTPECATGWNRRAAKTADESGQFDKTLRRTKFLAGVPGVTVWEMVVASFTR
jgi:hypothetical protein